MDMSMTHDITRETTEINSGFDSMCFLFVLGFLFVQFIPYIKLVVRFWLWENGAITYLFTGGGGSSVHEEATNTSVALETDIGLD